MSSWFSYFGFSKGPPLEEVKEESEEDETQVPEHSVPKTAEEELADAMNRLSPEQQHLIQDVLRRAENSRKEAKVVVDAEMMRSRYRQRESVEGSQEIDHRYSLVQMDSIPENMVTNEMEERAASQRESANEGPRSPRSPRSPNNARQLHEKRPSITEATTANLRNRFQKMKSHLTTWFNSLDYDGEYTFDFTSKPEKPETLGDLTMQYIDALSQAIMISSHIEYSHYLLSSNPQFHLMCTQFCESIFSLAFEEITHQMIDEKVRETLNGYCGRIAEEALQSAFFTMVSKTLSKSEECEQVLQGISLIHKSRSFESAQQLDQFLSTMEEENEDRESSRKSSPYMYEVLESSSDNPSSSSSREFRSQNSYESEMSHESPNVHVEELFELKPFDSYKTKQDEILYRRSSDDYISENSGRSTPEQNNEQQAEEASYCMPEVDEHYIWISGPLGRITEEHEHEEETRTESSSGSMILHEESSEPKMLLNVEQYIQTMIDRVNEIAQETERIAERIVAETIEKVLQETQLDIVSDSPAFQRSFDHEILEAVEESVMELEEMKEPELTQEEIDHIAWIQKIAEQSSFEQSAAPPIRPPVPIRMATVEEPVIATEAHEEEEDRSSATSGADFQQSFDHEVTYERSSPLLEPVEEPIMEPKEPELTQEEIDHIAWIQRMAEQSSFEQSAAPPTRPPVPIRMATQDEAVIVTEAHEEEEDRSSATSGADFQQSFDHEVTYERSSPLLEPVEEPIMEPKQPELTQEEIDHIAWIQKIAEQSSLEQSAAPPTRPPIPIRMATQDEAVIVTEAHEEEEDRSSATSGADFQQSFDHEDTYERSSPLLEPVEEPIMEPKQPELTQEEIDHIAWIQRMAEQSSFEQSAAPPTRPPVPIRMATQDEAVIVTEAHEEEEDRSSATSGADFQQSFDHEVTYERSSPLLEPVEEPIMEPKQPELTQAEIDHIAWIQKIAEQSSLEQSAAPPTRPPVPIRMATVEEPVIVTEAHEEEEDRSSATSGADFQQSFDHEVTYERSSPLLEPVEEPIMEPKQPELTQEEIDHIAWIQKIAEQSSFEQSAAPPTRPPVPIRMATQDEAVIVTEAHEEEEDRSSAMSGADFQQSFDHEVTYERSSPLLEPVEEPIMEPKQPELTQEEIDHIAWIQKIAEQSSLEQSAAPPTRPPIPIRMATQDEPVIVTEAHEEEEDRSSAMSGADFQQSFDHEVTYERSSPLLEPVEEPIMEPKQPELTQEEIDHIAWIQKIAEQSSLEQSAAPPTRPPVPIRMATQDEPVIVTEAHEEEDRSSATSGADFQQSFDHEVTYERSSPLLEPVEEPIMEPKQPELTQEEIDHIAWIQRMAEQSSLEQSAAPPTRPPVPIRMATQDEPVIVTEAHEEEDRSSATSGADFQQSFDHEVTYERSSPLLEPVEEPIMEPKQPELTQEEIDHIAWIQKIAEQSSLEQSAAPPTRPPIPIRMATQDEPVIVTEAHEEEEDRSSATSGADFQQSFDHEDTYERSSPLLEPVEEPIMEPKQPELTQEEIDHIAWIQRMAEQSSFEQSAAPPTRPPIPIRMATQDEPVIVTEAHEEEDRSSATSGADFQQSFDHEVTYERSSLLLEPVEEPIMEPKQPELTQEEIDHIAWIQRMAEQSSFEQSAAPPTRPPVPIRMATQDEPVIVTEAHEEEDRSSATSGADFQQSFDHEVTYERSSPLLEPVEEPIMEPKQPELTQEEIDHIAWIQRMAEQFSFEQSAAPPTRPPVPIRMATQDEPVIVTEAHEEEDRSSATSGADFQQSFDHEVTYERSSPLLEPVEEPIMEPKQPELTQEEIDHIAWIQRMAEQSSFEQSAASPTRPPVPIRMATVEEPVIATEAHEEEDRSSATSGADFQQSIDHDVTYERSSPLLEPVEEPIMEPKQPELTQEEIDHIAWIQKIAEQSSFEQSAAPPTRPPVPIRMATQDEPVIVTKAHEEEEDRSSATSGADFQQSFDHEVTYERSSPLLEPVEEPIMEPEQPELTQEEIDHIAWIQKIAEQSSLEQSAAPPTRPPVPIRMATQDEPVIVTEAHEEEDRSSATSGADFQQSFDHEVTYERSSPLLEPVEEPIMEPEQPELTQEEIDHIAWIQKITEQSSLEQSAAPPTRPPVPIRMATQDEPVIVTEAHEEEDRSSATSGADFQQSFDHEVTYERSSPLLEPVEEPIMEPKQPELTQEEIDHIAWIQKITEQSSLEQSAAPPTRPPVPIRMATQDEPVIVTEAHEEEDRSSATSGADFQQSFDHEVTYERSSPLLEPVEEPIMEPKQPELTQEEIDHIAWIQRMAEQSSFEQSAAPPTRPPVPIRMATQDEPVIVTEAHEEEDRSSATSGADFQQSFDHEVTYERSSPLLEPVEEPIMEPKQPELTQEEIDHIAWIQRMAEQSSFEQSAAPPTRPPVPIRMATQDEPVIVTEAHEEEDRSSATSGADFQQSFDHEVTYERSSPLLEPVEEPIMEPKQPELTQEEIDHIAWIQKIAEQSSLEQSAAPPTRPPVPIRMATVEEPVIVTEAHEEEEDRSSATSGADFQQSFDHEVTYERSSPLLEPVEEPIMEPKQPELTQEEIDHIAWIQKITEQSSLEQSAAPPTRPHVPIRMATQDEPVIVTEAHEEEDRSSATSGADFQQSFDHEVTYERSSPLLEPVEDSIMEPKQPELTQEEIDHIAWIQRMAEQSSFEQSAAPPTRPPVPIRMATVEEPVIATEAHEEEDRSSATSGADFQQSFDHEVTYERSSPLLEPVEEPIMEPKQPELTQEEIDHIAWIQKIAEQSSFEQSAAPPTRPPVPIRMATQDEPVIVTEAHEEEDRSSATSGADFQQSFDHEVTYERSSPLLEPVEEPIMEPKQPELTQEEIDHIAWIQRMAEQFSFEQSAAPPTRPPVPIRMATQDEPVIVTEAHEEEDRSSATSGADFQQSFDHEVTYERSSPLLEPVEEPIMEPKQPELTQEEIDHIAWIQRMAEQSSFEQSAASPTRPPVPIRMATVEEPVIATEAHEEEDRSSATSGADFQQSIDHDVTYERSSPLLEPVEEPIMEPKQPELTQEEIDHIAWIQKIAEQSSFEQSAAPPTRPPVPIRMATQDEPVIVTKAHEEEEDRSSATSGADFQQSFDHEVTYERSSPLLEPVEEPIMEPEQPELTQEEIDHIAWIQKITEQSSLEQSAAPPTRPPVPIRMATQDEPVIVTEAHEEEDRSSATSGADFQQSFDHEVTYERSSPLLEPVEEPIMEPKQPELTQEEIDHIAWIQKIAEQSSLEQSAAPPTRPPVPIRMATQDEPVIVTEAHEEEDRSSATSGADFQQSFDHEVTYERSSPLLEPVEEPIMEPEQPELTQEEIDHIAWIQKITEQSSLEQSAAPPTRPPVPIRMATQDEPVIVTEAHEEEDRSSATSGADFQQSFDHEVTYERSSPLLEPVEEPIMEPKQPELTQEEIDHIAWIQKITEQSSLEQSAAPPTRPPVPIRMATQDEPVIVTEAHEEEDRSSATSGADFQQSFDHEVTYERSSPLLEPVEEPIMEPKQPELTQEEIDHIAWIQRMAEQSSFEQSAAPPTRPPVPIRMATQDEPVIVTEAHEEEDRSSATSGADFQQSFDHEVTYERSSPLLEPVEEPIMEPKQPELTQEEIDHIAWIQRMAEQSSFEQSAAPPTRPPVPIRMATQDEPVIVTEAHEEEDRSSATSGADFQQSFDHEVTYERSSPLLEPVEEPIMEPKQPELTQEEIDHIAWIQRMAEQSSFEQSAAPLTRPPVPIRMATVEEPVIATEAHEEEDRSSATSGADFQQSFDHEVTYERSSPLLEPVEEPIMEPKQPELTQEEIDHIAWIQKIAEQSSFEQSAAPPTRPPVPIRMATQDEPVIVTEAHEEEDRSSATSGADFQQSFDHEVTYERSSPLLETVEEPIMEPKQPELTQEEIDHIAWIQRMAEQSSFEQSAAPPTRPPVPIRMATQDEPVIVTEAHEEEDRSSATSGADFQQSFDHEVTYERSSPLLEPVEEPIMEPKQPELTQEEIDHIAWIQRMAEQSSFEQSAAPPTRPPVPIRMATQDEPVIVTEAHEEEDRSSATSGADFQQSFDHEVTYERSSPLLEPVEEPIMEPKQPELTQEEIDHIAWIQKIAEQSSLEQSAAPPTRPPVPIRMATVEEPVIVTEAHEEEEDRSSATSGADFQQSFDHEVTYERSSPLLEPVEEPIMEPKQPELTQEEIDHIAWIQKITEQSSLEQSAAPPTRPHVPIRMATQDEPVIVTEAHEEEDRSSATSGADFQQSFDHEVTYERSSPLLEPVEDSIMEPKQPELTQEEIDHIAWIQRMAEQSSFEQSAAPPTRPPVPIRMATVEEPVIATEAHEEEDRSSATSGADFQQSFDHEVTYERSSPLLEPVEEPIMEPKQPELTQEEIDHIAWIQKIAEQSSFEQSAAPPTRPPVPIRMATQDEPVIVTEAHEEEDRSSATSGADFQQSFDHEVTYERSSPLLEPVEEPIMEPKQPELTQEEIDHIAWIQRMAEQSSLEQSAAPPTRPPVPIRMATVEEPVIATEAHEEEDRSSATSGADFQQSIDHDVTYERSSPLLEPVEEPIMEPKQPELTQEEIDHIAWIQKIAEQSSFEQSAAPPTRPPVPIRMATQDEPVIVTEAHEEEDRSSATSGADFQQTFDHEVTYERSSPLLEPVEEPIMEPKQPELTQEEIDHIAWIQKIAEQSSFEQSAAPPTRPPVPIRMATQDEPVIVTEAHEEEEDRSSATSGADFQQTFDHEVTYERSSPLLEPVEEPIMEPKQPELTQEEIDHIAWIQKIAEQSSLEQSAAPPTRPPVPIRMATVEEPVIVTEAHEEEEDRSSATSGADFQQSFDHEVTYERSSPLLEPVEEPIMEPKQPELTQEEIDHIAWIQKITEQSSLEQSAAPPTRPHVPIRMATQDEPVIVTEAHEEEDRSSATSGADFQQSIDHDVTYERSSPLLEPVEEPIMEPKQPELTQEEIDHIAWIQKIAEQSSFEQSAAPPTRPPVPIRMATQDEPVIVTEAHEEEEDRSSATSGADFQQTFDHEVTYERSSPLLEPVEEPIMEPKEPELTQEEIDHIASIQRMAEQSSFEQSAAPPTRPPVPIRMATQDEPVIVTEAHEEEDRSSATSGADFQQTFDHEVTYERSSPLLEPVEEPIMEPKEPELTQEEIDHIASIQRMAEQSSFEQAAAPPTRPPVPIRMATQDEPVIVTEAHEEEEDRSSATSGADFQQSIDHDVTYERSSPLLEPVEEPIMEPKQPELTQEEIDHIAWIQRMAEQSSFEQSAAPPTRPPVPIRMATQDEPVIVTEAREEEEDRSSATSGADFQQSFDHEVTYERSSPLLEPVEEPIMEPKQPELTQEKIDHIAWIQRMAEQSSFEQSAAPPTRSPVPIRMATQNEPEQTSSNHSIMKSLTNDHPHFLKQLRNQSWNRNNRN
ncbi:hypothetical protein B9Z55_013849 [Caenorhabditis nigoni]|uniref:Uncharacterized protein n=1 Tax=Caenorhabditis nigoni TaxID=1611254 RepID=A0A2G5U3H4_9PELO|nr:hypothetical protein B9Z55_013849 [Caenorhabditis nigoni]